MTTLNNFILHPRRSLYRSQDDVELVVGGKSLSEMNYKRMKIC